VALANRGLDTLAPLGQFTRGLFWQKPPGLFSSPRRTWGIWVRRGADRVPNSLSTQFRAYHFWVNLPNFGQTFFG